MTAFKELDIWGKLNFILTIANLTPIALKDLCLLSKLEVDKMKEDRSFEWCIRSPSLASNNFIDYTSLDHLPAEGKPGTVLELDNNRISIIVWR